MKDSYTVAACFDLVEHGFERGWMFLGRIVFRMLVMIFLIGSIVGVLCRFESIDMVVTHVGQTVDPYFKPFLHFQDSFSVTTQ